MSFQLPSKQVQFFVTAPAPCPYLPDRDEVKLFTYLNKTDGSALNDQLSQLGFRRAQNIAYRPACLSCDACKSSRVLVQRFCPSASMRRVLRTNVDLVRSINPPIADGEHYALICKYLTSRHKDGGMENIEESGFAELIEETCLTTELVDYRNNDGELIASVLIDQLTNGPSMVYSFFRPDMSKRSLGNFMILDHIERAKLAGKDYLYLGFWIGQSPKMNYKQRYQPLEILQGKKWKILGETTNEQT